MSSEPSDYVLMVCDTCTAQVTRNHRGRWECPEHGDEITVHSVQVIVPSHPEPVRVLTDELLDQAAEAYEDAKARNWGSDDQAAVKRHAIRAAIARLGRLDG